MRQNQEHTQEQLQLSRRQLQQTHELSQRQVTSSEQAQVTEDLNSVMEILATYVRVRSPWQPGHDFEDDLKEYKSEGIVYNPDATILKSRAPDIQAAMTVIGRREITKNDLPTLYFGAVDLRHSSLNSADLAEASFRRTYLQAAILKRVRIGDADFTEAKADRETTWPDGFDPIAAGITIEP